MLGVFGVCGVCAKMAALHEMKTRVERTLVVSGMEQSSSILTEVYPAPVPP